jgi:hypothetical protein
MRAGEASLAHDAADAGVVEDGDDELLELNLDGEHRLLLLGLNGAPPLVRLRALECGDERIGEGRRVVALTVVLVAEKRRGPGGGWKAVEGHVEAELEGLALQRVRVRPETRRAEEPRRRRRL